MFCFRKGVILALLAVRTGLEPATPCVTGMYSNQLNYRTSLVLRHFFFLHNISGKNFFKKNRVPFYLSRKQIVTCLLAWLFFLKNFLRGYLRGRVGMVVMLVEPFEKSGPGVELVARRGRIGLSGAIPGSSGGAAVSPFTL